MLPRAFSLIVILGAVLALPYVSYARKSRRPDVLFAAGLVIAAAIYVVFAVFALSANDVIVEMGGVLLFAAIAAGGLRWSPDLLAAGWLAHVGWDLLLHPVQFSGYAPWWYPALCIGFDVFVAGFIIGTRPPRTGLENPKRAL